MQTYCSRITKTTKRQYMHVLYSNPPERCNCATACAYCRVDTIHRLQCTPHIHTYMYSIVLCVHSFMARRQFRVTVALFWVPITQIYPFTLSPNYPKFWGNVNTCRLSSELIQFNPTTVLYFKS